MYVCMYLCMYVCTYVCMYVRMYACMYVCKHVLYARTQYTSRYVFVQRCVCVCADFVSTEIPNLSTDTYIIVQSFIGVRCVLLYKVFRIFVCVHGRM